MSSRRARTKLRGRAADAPYAVVCRRHDGREREWQRYSDRAEAELVAEHLSKIGCPARVATDDELALEPGSRPAP